jgi:hypothetical protein
MNIVQELPIDTRIIKTQYKNHELLARFWNGRYRGRIWKNKVKLADYTGDNIDLVLESLVQIVDQLRGAQYNERAKKTIELEDYINAWHTLLPRLDNGLLAILKTLARYKSHSATFNRMQQLAGYDTGEAILQQLNETDNALRDELLLEFYEPSVQVNPLYTLSPHDEKGPLLFIDDTWATALLRAEYETSSRSA